MKKHLTILLLTFSTASGFVPPLHHGGLSQAKVSLNMAKGRRGGLDVGSSSGGKAKPIGDNRDAPKKTNWIATSIPSLDSLPKETNTVKLVDTLVPSLTDPRTNPTGAVSIVNFKDEKTKTSTTYCFSASCACCKIPLTKGKVLPAKESNDARLQCDFCGATYNLRTGSPVEKEGGKLFGFLFSKNELEKLPVYGLGEKSGQVFINIS